MVPKLQRHSNQAWMLSIFSLQLLAFTPGLPAVEGAESHRIYVRPMDPREHPDDGRRLVKPPSWETFGNRTRFMTLRGFEVRDGQLVGYAETLDRWTREYALGDVIWPSYPVLFAKNIQALAEEIKRRKLFLFDIWGYVPGSGPGGYWRQFRPPDGVLKMFESTLGTHWLGMDNGEQDGRYVGGYASQMAPASAGRFEQYLNFHRHFESLCDELGNKMCALVSLNFGHYFLKEGVYSAIGAETAQALPNSQVYYAFIRGAGKQYGVPWFGNASVWNRWGWKSYGSKGERNGAKKGTSLNLMKRLLYSHILYNCVCVGFESGWFQGEELSPIGRIQQAARRWVRTNGQPGTMVTPTAVMLDFVAGWSFPRHLYTPNVYRVWGNLPYDPGDYLTDGVLDLLYPGYQNASYFHDERGFMTATPYGDGIDCILSDAPAWLLRQYAVIVVAGQLRSGAEIRDKLASYVQEGGRVVITAGSLRRLPQGLANIRVREEQVQRPAESVVAMDGSAVTESRPFALHRLELPGPARLLARSGDVPAAVEVDYGKGHVLVFASPFGIGEQAEITGTIENAVDRPLARPYPLLDHVRAVLDKVLQREILFDAGPGLSIIVCRKGPGEYTVGVSNNCLEARPLKLSSHCGPIVSVQEMNLDQSEKGAAGFLPEGLESAAIGKSGPGQIAGGDVRIFSVRIREENVSEIPHRMPPRNPHGRMLTLGNVSLIQEEILTRPTFFEHFDGVVVDWKYLHRREQEALRAESGWLRRQGLTLAVDLSSGVNLYPDLRLVDNSEEAYRASMDRVAELLAKMEVLGAEDLILSLHRTPENNFTAAQTEKSFVATLQTLCKLAETHGVTLHLRLGLGTPPRNVSDAVKLYDRVDSKNLRLAPNTGLLLAQDADVTALAGKVGFWLMAGSRRDIAGRLWDVRAPLAMVQQQKDKIAGYLAIAPRARCVLDAVLGSQDEEYRDARVLADIVSQRARE